MSRALVLSLMSGLAFAGLASPVAVAADLPMVAPAEAVAPVAPIAAFTWTGFYIGAHVGYADAKYRADIPCISCKPRKFDADGVFGGGQIGYNAQFGSFVLGAEADISGADLEGGFRDDTPARLDTKVNFFGTARGRVGFALDRVLVYGTGGLAYADIEGRVRSPRNAFDLDRKDDHIALGYAVGGGVEFAVWDNVTVKLEYLYLDLDKERFKFGRICRCVNNADIDLEAHTGKIGVNYKF